MLPNYSLFRVFTVCVHMFCNRNIDINNYISEELNARSEPIVTVTNT